MSSIILILEMKRNPNTRFEDKIGGIFRQAISITIVIRASNSNDEGRGSGLLSFRYKSLRALKRKSIVAFAEQFQLKISN